MSDEIDIKTLSNSSSLHWYHWFIIVASLVLTFSAWYVSSRQQKQNAELQFNYQANQIIQLVEERMYKYEDALLFGVNSIHAKAGDIDYLKWKAFSTALSIHDRYPGINGIGVIYYIPSTQLENYLAEQRQLRPYYGIHPEHQEKEYWPITYIEPLTINKQAEGLDMAHETNRYTAAKKARDTKTAQITGPIVLVQDAKKTPGFLFYVPFYDSKKPSNTVEERQESFTGIVYAPFIVEKLMRGALQNKNRLVNFKISDEDDVLYNELHTSSVDFDENPLFEKNLILKMYGRIWQFKIQSSTLFSQQQLNQQPLIILIGGLIIDAMLLVLFLILTNANKKTSLLVQKLTYDPLTGLPNRALFNDRVNQAIMHSKRSRTQLAICFLDVDNFKPVNDNYGHDVGDQLLIEVAVRTKACIREEDSVTRQGGDEFILLLGDVKSYDHCEKTLTRIHYSLSKPYLIDGFSHSITVSIGITLYPLDDNDIDSLVRHADYAMYQAKQTGRNRHHFFNAQQDQQALDKHHQIDKIKQALENNEFSLYYQPKVNMATGTVFGAEALIRWIHPEKGLIPPLDFLPIIEETELEIQIGDWVLNQALKQMNEWQDQGIKLEVSINIASYHLQSCVFCTQLDDALAKYPSVNSQQLQLEILESSTLGDIDTISNMIKSCQNKCGVEFSLDDFGTGYSSLTHLRSLAANTIKIDQSFVIDILDDPSDSNIIKGIIKLADSFNRKVIAEGVETTEHGLMLLIMGCTKAQGYGIAKPMPALDIPDWLNNYIPNQEWVTCANQVQTVKEKKLKLFQLALEHWQKYFIKNIQSSPDSVKCWPIRNKTKCHAGIWIKYEKQKQLFDANWLKKLEKSHESMHDITDGVYKQYQNGEINKARGNLKNIQLVFKKINTVLDQYE